MTRQSDPTISNDTLAFRTADKLTAELDSVRRCPVTHTWCSWNRGIVKRLSQRFGSHPYRLANTERPQQPVVSAHRAFTRFELEPSPMPEPRLENGGRVGGLCDRTALQILSK